MDKKLEQFWEWLQLSGGSFKGQPIPNYVLIFMLIIYLILIIMMITNKIKEYLMNLENTDVPYPEMDLPYGDFITRDAMTRNQIEGDEAN